MISVLVAVPMRLPRISSFIDGGSRLLKILLEHCLVEELGDESLHTLLLIGKVIFDKREGFQGQFNFTKYSLRYRSGLGISIGSDEAI